MKKPHLRHPAKGFLKHLALAAVWTALGYSQAATTGFNQTAAGPWDYNDTANWATGNINGLWDSSLTLAGAQTVTFATDSNLTTGLSFNYVGNQALTLRSSGVTNQTITLNGDISVNPSSNQTVTIGSAIALQNLNVDLDGVTRTFTVGASKGLTFTNVISNGGIIKSGTGTLTLSSANTYTGGTTISAGTLIAGNANALGASGTITLGDTNSATNAITLRSTAAVISRPITVANQGSGTVTFNTSGSGQFTGAITINRNITLLPGNSVNFGQGGISGTGDVTIANGGGWRIDFVGMSGGGTANTFTGNLYILSGGILNLGSGWSSSNKAIPDASTVNVLGTLNVGLGGNNETIDALTGSGAVALSAANDRLTLGSAGGSGTFSGVISGLGGITKTGAGTETLSGNNTYTSTTVVNNGTLKLSAGSLGNTAISFTGIGTLAIQPGSATTINLGTTVAGTAGATLNLGSQTFDMTDSFVSTCNLQQQASFATAGLTVATGATFKFNLGNSSADKLAVTKAASVAGTVNVTVDTTGATSLTPGTYNLITAASGLTTSSPTWQFTGGGTSKLVTVGGLPFSLTLVPSATAIQVTVASAAPTQFAITSVNGGSSAVSGTPFSVVVEARDAGGTARNVLADTAVTLSLYSGTGGTLAGTLSGTITAGTSSKTITGVTCSKAEIGVALTATRTSGDSLSAANSSSFTVLPGAAASLTVSGFPASQPAGIAANVTVTAKDAAGNTASGYTGTVSLTSSDGSASLPGSHTFTGGEAGVHVFSVTLNTAGTQSITAGDGTFTNSQSGIAVYAGAPDHFDISTISSPQTAGTAITGITITAKRADNTTLTSFESTVTFGGTAGITGESGGFSAGVLSGVSVTPLTAGSAMTFTVTLGTATGTSTFDVNPGALNNFAISTIASPQTAGTAITGITLTARDANNNTLSAGPNTFTGTVAYSGTAGITGTSASFTAGVLNGLSVTPLTAGTGMTLIVTASGMTGTQTFDVNPDVLDHFAIAGISSPATAGTAITGATLTAKDSHNNTVSSFTGTVTYSGTAGITGTSASFTAGVLSGLSVTPTTAGSGLTLIVTDAISSKTGTSTFDVNPGALHHFAISAITSPQTAGTAITGITLTAQDANNNTLGTGPNTFTGTVAYSGTAGITGTSDAFTAGVLGGASVTPTTAGTGMTLIVTASGKTGTQSFDVSPGVPNKLVFGIQPSNTAPGAAISPAVTVKVADANGNTVTGDTRSVSITSSATAFGGTSILTVSAVNGVATFSAIKPTTLGTGYMLKANDGSLTEATSSAFNVAIPVQSFIPLGNTTTTVGAGDTYIIGTSQTFKVAKWNQPNAILNQTGGSITVTGSWGDFGIGSTDGPTWGEYNMSGNATFSATSLSGASTAYSFTITGHLGKSKLTMTDNAVANIGSLTLKPRGGAAARVVLSGSASLTVGTIGNATDGYVIGTGCYIDFVSGSLATLSITGTHNFTSLVNAGSIRIDGATTTMSQFVEAGNTLALVPSGYSVTYDANGASSGTLPTDANTYATAATVTVLGNTGSLTKTGYTFTGWNSAANGSGTHYGETFAMGSANVTLYAEWKTPYEAWATDYASGQTAEKDANNDGVANGVACFMGMNGLATNPGVVENTVTWPYVNDVAAYEVQVSDNLIDWAPASSGVELLTGPRRVTFTLPNGPGITKKFCRLAVTP